MFVGHTQIKVCTGCSSKYNKDVKLRVAYNMNLYSTRKTTLHTLLKTQISPLGVGRGTPCPL